MYEKEAIEKIRELVCEKNDGDMSILVLHRGWIFVGDIQQDGEYYELKSAYNVRKWDSGGFGGLTKGAKSSHATLDKCQDVRCHRDAIIFQSPLPEGWLDE